MTDHTRAGCFLLVGRVNWGEILEVRLARLSDQLGLGPQQGDQRVVQWDLSNFQTR